LVAAFFAVCPRALRQSLLFLHIRQTLRRSSEHLRSPPSAQVGITSRVRCRGNGCADAHAQCLRSFPRLPHASRRLMWFGVRWRIPSSLSFACSIRYVSGSCRPRMCGCGAHGTSAAWSGHGMDCVVRGWVFSSCPERVAPIVRSR